MIEYHFTKYDYSSGAVRPLVIGVVFCTALSLYLLIKMFIDMHRRRKEFCSFTVKEKLQLCVPILSVAYIAFFVMSYIWPTLKYSRFLPLESEYDSISFYGQIECISPVQHSPKFTIGDEKVPRVASIVNIDGKEFYFLTAEGLSTGMRVEINYLPRSHMVLDCVQIE